MERRNTIFQLALAVFYVTFFFANVASSKDCKILNNLNFYEELNCKPEKDDNGCITSYNCSTILQQSDNKCYFRGKEYAVGDVLAMEDIPNNCIPAPCVCISVGVRAQFNCPHLDCPEFFQAPLRPSCVRTYSHDSCCAQGTYCHDSKETQEITKCKNGGQEYLEGGIFYPEEAPCKKCICMAGFNGKLESPWCEDTPCDTEIHNSDNLRDFCAPVYYGNNSCCPIKFFCRNELDGEYKVPSITQKGNEYTAKCIFGNETLHVGQVIENSEECTRCVCDVPPFVKCILDPDCQSKRSA